MPPASFFFLKIAVAIWGLLCFQTNFRIVYSIYVKNAFGIFIGIVLILQIALGKIDILRIFILPIPEQGTSFLLFVFSLVNALELSVYALHLLV